MKVCLAGPYVGEFGWELFNWQGFLRKRRAEFDYMHVISRPNRHVLYEDFAEFFPVEIKSANVNMCYCHGVDAEKIAKQFNMTHCKYTDFIPFNAYKWRRWGSSQFMNDQEFIRLGTRGACEGVDILMHVRNCSHAGSSFRNWYFDSAKAYADWAIAAGCSVACVGRWSTYSLHIDGTQDMRDISARDEVDIFANSGMIIGSQSGPHHLACLCGLPVVAWQTKAEHAARLSKFWNPFGVKTITNHPSDNSYWNNQTKNSKHWQPSLEWMQEATVEILKERR